MNTMMSLEKDKYYVIISELPDDQFHLVAYDTTGKKYKFNFSAKELQIEYHDETGEKLDLPENVVKVDFGKEQ